MSDVNGGASASFDLTSVRPRYAGLVSKHLVVADVADPRAVVGRVKPAERS